MPAEVCSMLALRPGDAVIDMTFGAGGELREMAISDTRTPRRKEELSRAPLDSGESHSLLGGGGGIAPL